jgi:tRNA dimethylallyltransferase
MQDTVEKEINLILSNNKTPIIVGGSLLYIDCLIRNYKLLSVGRTADYSNLSNEEIYNQLFKLDPIQAEKIGINNRKRIERAYELISTGNKMYETSPSPYNFLVIKIEKDKEEINNLINKRVNQMFEDG